MKMQKWARFGLAALPLLAGCKGFWDAPVSTTTTTTTLSSGDFFVLNVATSQIVGYAVNAGALTELPGSPVTLSSAPIAITVAPNNAVLYVSTLGGIFVYTIDSTGQLAIGNSSQPISSDPATSMQVDSSSSWLVEAISGAANVTAIHVNASNGTLASNTEETRTLPSSAIQQVAVAPDDSYVFVAMGSGGTAVIPFNSANANPFGAVSTIAAKNAAGAAISVAVDPGASGANSPRLLYIGETAAVSGSNSGGLRVFNYGSGFKELSGSPFAISGLAPYSILPFSTGDYVYVVNRQTSNGSTGVIAGFSITDTNNVFSLAALGSTFGVGTNPQAMVEDNTASFVFAVDYGGSPDLEGYVIDSTNAGYLDSTISSTTGTDPVHASAIAAMH